MFEWLGCSTHLHRIQSRTAAIHTRARNQCLWCIQNREVSWSVMEVSVVSVVGEGVMGEKRSVMG
jgi:hypothetical protein